MGYMDYYTYLMEECADPRTQDWFLVRSPVPVVTILLIYCFLIFVAGPNYMKDRAPYSCQTFLRFYNVFQIIINAYIVYSTATSGWSKFGFGCEPLNISPTGDGYNMAATVWILYIVKLIDLSETIVFTLRKKERQISFLHVYHHMSTAFFIWIFVKWFPGGGLVMVMIINAFVHVVMYSYYLGTTGGAALQKLANRIKPWITVMQMVQFVILMIHSVQFVAPSCDTPLPLSLLTVGDLFINFCMFYHFYNTSYRLAERSVKSE